MAQAKKGDTVKVHYTGTLSDGTVFDSSVEREPLEFSLGGKMVIAGFEEAVDGMAVGDKKTVTIPVDQAYGAYNDALTVTVEKARLPEDIDPEVGMMLQFLAENGQPAQVVVTEVTEETVTLDGNHPLAGHDLTFEIELVEIA